MESMSELYIDEIVSSLLEHRAAVLVGAGFSRNADPVNNTIQSKMPMWNELIDKFCDKLGIDDKHRKYLNTLTVAQELKESYGRPYLEKMIRTVMDNDAYEPSDIHVSLMNLHWSDVFTTNYDTLLERAAKKVADYKYQFILDQKDLIYSAGTPRLIKLHGSFPSNGPFIITEEDFRTYPADHAPFVNTVQQSLLENTFCLIGFSGDDPNFLKWIGWIHDNLGIKNSPVIYLITHRHFSAAKENDFTSQKIKVIVLDDIKRYQNKSITTDEDYIKELYRNFLKDLVKRTKETKEDGKNWPGSDAVFFHSEQSSLQEIYNKLEKIHRSYPGWILSPFRKHKTLSSVISSFEKITLDRRLFKNGNSKFMPEEIEHFKKAEEEDAKLTETEKAKLYLAISYEYCWLNSISGRPLSIKSIKDMAFHLEKYEALSKEEKTSELERQFRFILLMELRSFRIYKNEEEWNKLYDSISKLPLSTDEKNQLIYEDVYHDIYNLKFTDIEKKTSDITADKNYPLWCLKKAGLLASIGRYTDATTLLLSAVNDIRFATSDNSITRDIRSRSIESCLVTLYNFVIQAQGFSTHNLRLPSDEFLETPKRDTEFDFIWDQENSQYATLLSDEYEYKPETITQAGFDLGGTSTSTSLGRDNTDYFTALSFISFREETGVPYKLSNVVNKNGIIGAAKRLAPYSAILPIVLSILSEEDKAIKGILSRSYLASLNVEDVDELTDICLECLNASLDILAEEETDVFNKNLRVFSVCVLPEALSRFCTRCSAGKFDEMLSVLQKAYENWSTNLGFDLREFVKRLIESIPLKRLFNNIDVFWKLPISPDRSVASLKLPECFQHVYLRVQNIWTEDGKHLKLQMTNEKEKILKRLFDDCKKEEIHHNAIRRLTYISTLFDLSADDEATVKSIIFDPDNVENGKPYIGDFYQPAISRVIGNEDGDDEGKYWEALVAQIEKNTSDKGITDYTNMLNSGISYAQHNQMTEEQVQQLATVLYPFCKKLADNKTSVFFGFIDGAISSSLSTSAEFMGEAILSSGLACGEKSYSSDAVRELRELFQATDTPSSLLDFCVSQVEDRENHYLSTLFCGKKKYAVASVKMLYSLNRHGIPIGGAIKRAFVNALITAMGIEVTSFVQAVEYLVREGLYSDDDIRNIDQVLPKFLDLTAINENDSNDAAGDKLELRKWVAYLAHTLYKVEKKKGQEVTQGVEMWKEINTADNEFAEIRNSWDDVEC